LKAFARVKDFSRAPVNRQNDDKPLAPSTSTIWPPLDVTFPSRWAEKNKNRTPLLF